LDFGLNYYQSSKPKYGEQNKIKVTYKGGKFMQQLISEEQATGRVKEIFDDIKSNLSVLRTRRGLG
jgi:hypothetical protein